MTAITNLQPPGNSGDPFSGTTWQGWFQQLQQALASSGKDIDSLLAWMKAPMLPQFVVASLPGTTTEGQLAYATNGRKVGEGAGSGTGVPVYWSTGSWRVYSTDAAVAA